MKHKSKKANKTVWVAQRYAQLACTQKDLPVTSGHVAPRIRFIWESMCSKIISCLWRASNTRRLNFSRCLSRKWQRERWDTYLFRIFLSDDNAKQCESVCLPTIANAWPHTPCIIALICMLEQQVTHLCSYGRSFRMPLSSNCGCFTALVYVVCSWVRY